MRIPVSAIVSCVLPTLCFARLARAQNYTTLDDPLAISGISANNGPAEGTFVTGISGGNVVGYYNDQSGNVHGFLFNGNTYNTLDDPLGIGGTFPRGVSGNNIVGCYVDANGNDKGFLYNGTTYMTLIDPANPTAQMVATGVDGSNIVGYENGGTGFFYDGKSFNILPSIGITTMPLGISGGTIVGEYTLLGQNIGGAYGFSYIGGNYTYLSSPSGVFGVGATNNDFIPDGIFGSELVGNFGYGGNAVFYDGSSFTAIEDPQASGSQYEQNAEDTFVTGVDGKTVVGYYHDWVPLGISSGYEVLESTHGFIATVPEPASTSLTILAAIGVMSLSRVSSRHLGSRRGRTVVIRHVTSPAAGPA